MSYGEEEAGRRRFNGGVMAAGQLFSSTPHAWRRARQAVVNDVVMLPGKPVNSIYL
jgi:hypothetical protein